MLQALVKVALSSRVHHPNIVPVLGVAEYPSTKELLLVRMGTANLPRQSFSVTSTLTAMIWLLL